MDFQYCSLLTQQSIIRESWTSTRSWSQYRKSHQMKNTQGNSHRDGADELLESNIEVSTVGPLSPSHPHKPVEISDWKKLLCRVSRGRLCRSAYMFPKRRQCPYGIVTALVEYLRPFSQPCESPRSRPQHTSTQPALRARGPLTWTRGLHTNREPTNQPTGAAHTCRHLDWWVWRKPVDFLSEAVDVPSISIYIPLLAPAGSSRAASPFRLCR